MSPRAAPTPIRVLAVDHTAGIPTFRKKFEALAAHPELDLTVFAPDRWVENYQVVRAVSGPQKGYRVWTGAVGWPGYENRAFFRSGLGAAIRRARPDILHLWEEPFSVIALQALWHAAIWAPRAKAIFCSADNLSRDFRYSYRPSWFYASVERLVHRRCSGGTAVSEDVADVLRAKGFRKPLEIVPLGIDLADYPAAVQDGGEEASRRATAEEVRARFGMNPPVVGFIGRILHQKGVDVLLRAAALMPEPKPSLVIVGEGPDRAALQSLAVDLGIAARTRFLHGVPHEEVPGVLAAIDVLVLPSRATSLWKEQFGRILVEGMAAGCVVIGSSSGAIPHVLGDAGLVFREEDSESLARMLHRVLDDPGLASALRVKGRRRVRSRYTWDSIADGLVDFYRRLHSPSSLA